MANQFNGVYAGLKVLLTGHTGFKGSWLALWLQALGAEVTGLSLEPETDPNFFTAANVAEGMDSRIGDIRDVEVVKQIMADVQPDIVFHLAAQALVLPSYEFPKETFDINAAGTVNILEAIRTCPSVRAAVMITTDKVYDNQEWTWGYRESDKLGGNDPYSASKAMAELACHSYRASFFSKDNRVLLATARAGNVIGGGDFSPLRILPDCMRALSCGVAIDVRNKHSIRPWLHVLEPLSGYLLLGQKLLEGSCLHADSWNFGPLEHQGVSVQQVVEEAIACWGEGAWRDLSQPGQKREMHTLKLNWDKAASLMGWEPQFTWQKAVFQTVEWFKAFTLTPQSIRAFSLEQIEAYANKSSCAGIK